MSAKRVLILSSLLGATLFAQDARATLAPMLPESSHYQGFVWYDEYIEPGPETGPGGYLRGRIDFAVYKTDESGHNEFTDAGYEAPGEGDYIYAYQIFNDYAPPWWDSDGWQSDESVAYFAVLGIDMTYVDIVSIGSQEDPESGVKPSPVDPLDPLRGTGEYFTETDAVWEFGTTSWDWINGGGHSMFLVFRSNKDWSRGDYEIRGPEPSDLPIPEPAMLTLFSIGGAILLRRGKE